MAASTVNYLIFVAGLMLMMVGAVMLTVSIGFGIHLVIDAWKGKRL